MGMPDCADCQGNAKGWQVKMIRSGRKFMAFIIMFVLITCVWLAVYLPPYEKFVYSKIGACGLSAAKERSYCITGCQGGGDIPVVDATDSSQSVLGETGEVFVLKINAKNLKPMNVYRTADYSTAYETDALKVMLLRTKESYAQYYMAEFANGEKLPVLINNRIIKIPHSGQITLPISQKRTDSNLTKISGWNLQSGSYIDAATGIEHSPEMASFRDTRTLAFAGLFIIACIGVIIRMAVVYLRRQ